MVEYLLLLGMDTDGSDEVRGFRALGRPLHYTVSEKMLKKAMLLLVKGAKVKIRSREASRHCSWLSGQMRMS